MRFPKSRVKCWELFHSLQVAIKTEGHVCLLGASINRPEHRNRGRPSNRQQPGLLPHLPQSYRLFAG